MFNCGKVEGNLAKKITRIFDIISELEFDIRRVMRVEDSHPPPGLNDHPPCQKGQSPKSVTPPKSVISFLDWRMGWGGDPAPALILVGQLPKGKQS